MTKIWQDTCIGTGKSPAEEIPEGWVPFWFEANQAFGWVDCPGRWELVRNIYSDDVLERAYSNRSGKGGNSHPEFGFRFEHSNQPTLGDWARENGMQEMLFPGDEKRAGSQ